MRDDRHERRTRPPRRLAVAPDRRRSPLRQVVDAVRDRYDWRTLVVLVASLLTAASLMTEPTTSPAAHAPVLVAGVAWLGVGAAAAVRRRLSAPEGGAFLVWLAATVVLVGLTGPGVRWICTSCLVGVPVLSVMFFRTRGTAAFAVLCAAGSSVLIATSALPVEVALRTAAALVVITAAPVAVLVTLLRQLEAAHADTALLAATDQLTGLLNRHGLQAGATALLAEAGAAGEPVTVMIADIDHFKAVNDTHGHAVGDEVLAAVSVLMRSCARTSDLLVRMGGEEIVWVAHFPSPLDVARAAERLRAGVAAHRAPGLPAITISIGVATAVDADAVAVAAGPDTAALAGEAVHRLIARADTALYEAKRAGRDRVVVAGAGSALVSGR